ncbi:hypothetical protein A4X13_0g6738 [Tilletia indica]|uniref:Impact N-terminal domain-containing protein n=1 Tax=Tilletia indica TaxID=43049 RepID=A0A177T8Q1_9BASI|nr:hypothetical protein A4X13_0g6738 [Tilletia indica]
MSLSRLRARGLLRSVAAETEEGGRGHDSDDEEDDAELPSRPSATIRAKGKARQVEDEEEEEEEVFFSEDLDDSADEWTPQQGKSASSSSLLSKRPAKRGRHEDDDTDEDNDVGASNEYFSEDEGDRPAPPKRGKKDGNVGQGRGGKAAFTSRTTASKSISKSTPASSSFKPAGPSKSLPQPSTATSTSAKPNLGRAAGLAALAQGSNMSAKEIIDRLHRARAMAENDFRRERGESLLELDAGSDGGQVRGDKLGVTFKDGKGGEGVALTRNHVPSSSAPEGKTSETSKARVPPPALPSTQAASTPTSAPRMSVASWLGVVPHDTDLPWPTITPAPSMIQDRDSLFIAFVFPFPPTPTAQPSTFPTLISSLLSHLVRTVQPSSVPVDLLPEHLQSAPVQRRGASHDMYAVRAKVLKFGRDGSRGGSDWTSWEGADDDGEKWGAQKIAKVIQEENAENVLVFVSRWYGGTLLGPDRFTHITNVARATLREHMANQRIAQLRQTLEELDTRAASLRASLSKKTAEGSSSSPSGKPAATMAMYADLTEAKGQRLLVAKRKMVELLEKKVKEVKGGSG